jgi:ribosomal protein S18 acetylase RimI-like enzyme
MNQFNITGIGGCGVRFLAESLDGDSKYIFSKQTSNLESNIEPNINIDIDYLSSQDLSEVSNSGYVGANDSTTLADADICVVAKFNDHIIHHTCIAIESFVPPRSTLKLHIPENDAFVYAVETDREYRGEKVALAVLGWIEQKLSNMGIERLFTYVWEGNKSSQNLFKKAGYSISGSIHSKLASPTESCYIIVSEQKIFDESPVIHSNLIKIYRSEVKDLHEVSIGLINAKKMFESSNVALFGAGGHSCKLAESSVPLGNWISVVFDNDPNKQGNTFDPINVPIRSPTELTYNKIDYVIISSKAYQDKMVEQVRDINSEIKIVTLYPEVQIHEY